MSKMMTERMNQPLTAAGAVFMLIFKADEALDTRFLMLVNRLNPAVFSLVSSSCFLSFFLSEDEELLCGNTQGVKRGECLYRDMIAVCCCHWLNWTV